MGVRVVNLSTLVERGGALYVAYSTISPADGRSATIIESLKVSSECEVFDAARLSKEGMEATYMPISMGSMITGDDKMGVSATCYRNPTAVITEDTIIWDTNIYIWVEGTTDQDLSIEFEQVHNWEAIPYPSVEFLFDRKVCVGSDEAKAVALSSATSPAINTVRTSKRGGNSLVDKGMSALSGIAKTVGGQVVGMAKKGLASLTSALFGLDYYNHRTAVSLGLARLSPVRERKFCGMARLEYLTILQNALDAEARTRVESASSPPPTPPVLVRSKTGTPSRVAG
jgi:hypothetical protein